MFQPQSTPAEDAQSLVILNHRAEPLTRVVEWFKGRGWDVKVSNHLQESRQLLRKPATAALVYPLTLLRDGI